MIAAEIINDGLIRSDFSGGSLELTTYGITNNADIVAVNVTQVLIRSIAIDQTGGGRLLADGGTLRVAAGSAAVIGGDIQTINAGLLLLATGATLTLVDGTLTGDADIRGGSTLELIDGLRLDGTVVVNSNSSTLDAIVHFADAGTVDGVGTILLNRPGGDSQLTAAAGQVVTLGADTRVEGRGQVHAGVVNNGTIEANFNGSNLELLTADKVNNALIRASGGGIIVIDDIDVINSASGVIRADDASRIDFAVGSDAVRGGTLSATGSGKVRVLSSASVTLCGTLNPVFESGYTPAKNDRFTIVTAGSIAGDFDSLDAPPLSGGLVYRIVKSETTVDLRIVCSPDLNADGLLDFFDVQFFLQAFSMQDPIADYNEDGTFDFFDVQAFLNAFSVGCP